jgi:hypothetical protein
MRFHREGPFMSGREQRVLNARAGAWLAALLGAGLPLSAAPAATAPQPAKTAAPTMPAPDRKDGMEIVTLPTEGGVTRAEITTEHYKIYLERYNPEDTGRLMEAAYRAWAAFFGKEPPRGKDGKPVRMTVKGYATPERYQAGGKADGTPTPSGAPNMGMYWTGTSIAHFYAPSGLDCMRYMILHEAMHQFHYIATTGNGGASSGWLVEGLAIWSGASAWDGKTFRLGGRAYEPLGGRPRTLAGITSDNPATVAFLTTQYPLEFCRLLAALNQRRDEREAWKEAFGFEEAPAEFVDEFDAWAKSKLDAGFTAWEPLVLRRAAFAAANVAAWRLGKAAPSSLARLREGMKAALEQGEAHRVEAVQLFRQGVSGVLQDFGTYPAEAAAVVRPAAEGLVEAAVALKVKTAPPPAIAAAPPPRPRAIAKLVDPGALPAYETKLRVRVQALVAAGRRLQFEYQMLASTIRIASMDAQGNMQVLMEGGSRMDLAWTQLLPVDKLKLALVLVENEVEATLEDQALVAFFLLLANKPEKAEGHLRSAGKLGESVRAAFRIEEQSPAGPAGTSGKPQ